MATLRKSGRESTPRLSQRRYPFAKTTEGGTKPSEVQQVRRVQAEEEVLPQQAAVQTLPGGPARGAQSGAGRGARQGAREGVQAHTKVLTTSANIGVP